MPTAILLPSGDRLLINIPSSEEVAPSRFITYAHLYEFNVLTQTSKYLYRGEEIDSPCLSADGNYIAFIKREFQEATYPGYSNYYVHVINTDGTGETRLLGPIDGRQGQYWGPVWSPAGHKILYGKRVAGEAGLYYIDLDTEAQFNLVHIRSNSVYYQPTDWR